MLSHSSACCTQEPLSNYPEQAETYACTESAAVVVTNLIDDPVEYGIDLDSLGSNDFDNLTAQQRYSSLLKNSTDQQNIWTRFYNVPASVLLKERAIIDDQLKPLYCDGKSVKQIEMNICGKVRTFAAFHHAHTIGEISKRKQIMSFIDTDDTVELYRWDLKGALATIVQLVSYLIIVVVMLTKFIFVLLIGSEEKIC